MKKVFIIGGIFLILSIGLFIGLRSKPEQEDQVSDVTESVENTTDDKTDPIDSVEPNPEVKTIDPLKSLWTFEEKSIGQWPDEVPYINPLYAFDAYSSYELNRFSEHYLTYVDTNAALIEDTVYGDVYHMTIDFKAAFNQEENIQLLYDLEDYLEMIDAQVLGRYYDSVTFECTLDDTHWTGELSLYNEKFDLYVVKEQLLVLNQVLTLKTDSYPEHVAHLSTRHDGTEYLNLELYKDQGDVSLSASSKMQVGHYKRVYTQSQFYADEYGTTFHLDQLPYDSGRIDWEIIWDGEVIPEEITLKLSSTGILPTIQHGEALGAIKVSAEAIDSVSVLPTSASFLSIDHPEYYMEANELDHTPDGDYLIYVPSGLWDVTMSPAGDSMVSTYETQMVPVNSGQVTEVIIPASVSEKLKLKTEFAESGMEIRDVTEMEDQVRFRFTLIDPLTSDVKPSRDTVKVLEGGMAGEIKSVTPVDVPPSVVLLLDSSGSMKGQMAQTLSAAENFIKGLPEETYIKVIDFDSSVKILQGDTTQTVLESLQTITTGGATTLYDAVLEGLTVLEDRERATLVVFTDGEDANLNDTAQGSFASLEEVLSALTEHNIPLYTIGFGEEHDQATLEKMATVTAGRYYAATDQMLLSQVFQAINSKLSNTYDVVYQRPKANSLSDIPVVSIVVDNSGSMGEDMDNGRYRLMNVQELLHDVIIDLPDDMQYQLSTFTDATSIKQTLTTDRVLVMRGIAAMEAGGGTDIYNAASAAFATMKTIPSSKKVILYITDEALGVSDATPAFLDLLKKIGESEITVLWVGLGVEDAEEDFRLAAELSQGDYIVTNDSSLLREKFDTLVSEVIAAPSSELVTLNVQVEKSNPSGEREYFTASRLVDLSPKEITDNVMVADTIHYAFTDLVAQYDQKTAKLLTGASQPVKDSIITSRMDAKGTGANEAAELSVNELFLLDRLAGVDAPSGYQYLALDVQLDNIMPLQEVMVYPDNSAHPANWVSGAKAGHLEMKKIAYQIPSFVSHLFLSYNNKDTLPASTATWLVAEPLVTPGNYSLTIEPEQSQTGLLVFIVPDEVLEQCSLHFYDTQYGHIDIPVIGKADKPFDIRDLPTVVTTNLSDTFGLSINDVQMTSSLTQSLILEDASTFAVLSGNFTSNMQALIDINPKDRILLSLATASGSFMVDLSPVTTVIPGGFYHPRMIAPGAENYVEMVYQIPKGLMMNSKSLLIDLQGEDRLIPVETGNSYPSGHLMTIRSDYFDLMINDFIITDTLMGLSGMYGVLDLTVEDKPDGSSTVGIPDYFIVQNLNGEVPEETTGLGDFTSYGTDNTRTYSNITDELLLGFSEDTIVYDGQSRRGYIIFDLSKEGQWELAMPYISEATLAPEPGRVDETMFASPMTYEEDYVFSEAFSEALTLAVEQYQASHLEEMEALQEGTIPLDKATDLMDVPAPSVTVFGQQLQAEMITPEKMIETFKSMRCIPSDGSYGPFRYNLSTEALLMQGYGTEQDYAHAAVEMLSQMGYSPEQHILRLTPRGREQLSKITGFETNIDVIPGISYQDGKQKQLLLIPFMAYFDEVDDVVYIDADANAETNSTTVTLEVILEAEYTAKGITQTISDINDALGGETDNDHIVEITMFYDNLDMSILSQDPIDIGFGLTGQQVKAFVLTGEKEKLGEEVLNIDNYTFKTLLVNITLPNGEMFTFKSPFDERMTVDQKLLTLAINLPDINTAAAEQIAAAYEKTYDLVVSPSPLTALQWYSRKLITEFLVTQYRNEQELMSTLKVDAGHIYRPKIIAIEHNLIEGKLRTTMDLVQPTQMVFEENNNANTYRLMSGLFDTTLEADVLDSGLGLEKIWGSLSSGTDFYILDNSIDDALRSLLLAKGMTEEMLADFENQDAYILIPSNPAMIAGQPRWAWLEMNPNTYEVIGVVDDFTHGASIESAIIDTVKNAGQFMLGAFKGVETSVWSVAAFSLEESDYNLILKNAKAFALGIAKQFGVSAGKVGGAVGGNISASQSVGPVNLTFDGKFDVKQNVLGYTEGFIEGIKLYFDLAK